jgi:lactate dehydrogenase-like 2-hydroxyacid dehydrogenase
VSITITSERPFSSTVIMSKPVKLAILDDYQNLAPAKFDRLVSSGRLEVASFPDTLDPREPADKAALIERLKPFEIISTMRERTPFRTDILETLPNLKLLLTTGTRNASIDSTAAAQRGIVVAGTTNEARQPPDSTTQHTWALILGLARHIARDDAAVKSGAWQGTTLALGLPGLTLGLLGLGRLGAATARIAISAFNMKVVAWSSSLTQERADETAKQLCLPVGSIVVAPSKLDLLRTADIVSIHYVLSDRSRGLVGKEELAALKPTALLINTSRGPLIDEVALLETLKAGRIRGAALDVFDKEPLPADSQWRTTAWGEDGRSEVLLSPHMGYGETTVINSWYEQTAANVERWLDGKEILNRMN